MYVGSYLDLSGKSVKSSREDLRIAKGCDVILATYGMMLEGTDIPALDTLVFATPRVEIEQVVGRIQRRFEGKKGLLIVDPVFQTPYLTRLSLKRIKLYKKLGFSEKKS
jgi:predicted helicase